MAKKTVKAVAVKPAGSDKWIAGAIKRPGQLHRDLHVPEDKPIQESKLIAASKQSGKVGQRARLAMTLKGMKKGSKK